MSSPLISDESLHLSQKLPYHPKEKFGQEKNLQEFQINRNQSFSSIDCRMKPPKILKLASPMRKKHFVDSRKSFRLSNFAIMERPSPVIIKRETKRKVVQETIKRQSKAALGKKILINFRRRKFYSNYNNLNEYHFKIIGDFAEPLKEKTTAWQFFLKNYCFKTLFSNILSPFTWKIFALKEKGRKLNYLLRRLFPVWDSNSPLKIFWDLLLMALTLVRLFSYSIEKSFLINLELEELGFSLNILLLANIAIKLNTNFYRDGSQVIDRKKILKNFFRSHALTDLMPSLALSIIYFSNNYYYLRDMNIILCLRLYDAVDLEKRIRELIIRNDKTESLYSLVILVMKILIWGHLIACMWRYVSYIAFEEDPNGDSWLKLKGVIYKGWKTQYLYSIYWAVTTMLTVGYGDITPTNEREMMFNIAAMFLGCGMFGYSMNSIGEILKASERGDRCLKELMNQVKLMMGKKHIPTETQIKVKKYIEFVWRQEQKENPQQEKMIMSKLSSKLREEVFLSTNVKLLKSVPALKGLSKKTLISLANYMRKVRFSPEEHVYREGDYEDLSLFFVIDGTLELLTEREGLRGKNISWKKYRKDDYFGVNEIFTGRARNFSVVSTEFSTLFQLSRRDIMNTLQNNPLEHEKFCKIRDLELLYLNFDQYKIACSSCGSTDHMITDCKFLAYKPPSLNIIGRHLMKKKRWMMNYKRKRAMKHGALIYKNQNQQSLNDFLTIYQEDPGLKEHIKFYENVEKDKEIDGVSLKSIDSPTRKKIKKKAEEENESPVDDEEKNAIDNFTGDFQSSHSLADTHKSRRSMRNISVMIRKPQREKSSITQVSAYKPFEIKSEKNIFISDKEIVSHRKEDISVAVQKFPKPPPLTPIDVRVDRFKDFDKVYSYNIYFPRNNIEVIASKINSKAKTGYLNSSCAFKLNSE